MEVRPGYKQTEVGVIPVDWDITTVGREFDIKLGKMLDAEKNVGVPKPYLGNKAVQWDRIDISDLPTVPMSRTDIEKFRLRKGDLLVCEGGDVGRAAIWDAPIDECYYQKALHRLRPLRGYDSRLMVALLRHWSVRGLLANYVTQTSIAHLPREKFLEVPLLLPPRPEQCAIAVALSDVEALIESLEQLIAKKRRLKQGVMQELLTGRTRLPGFTDEWKVKNIGEFTDCVAGGTPSTLVSSYWGGTIRWMSSGELNQRFVSEVAGRITEEGLRNSATTIIPKNCVLVGLAGQGKTRGTVAINLIELCTNQSIAAILPNPAFVPDYLYYNLDMRYDELRGLSSGEGGRGGLNLTIIKSVPVRFPKIEEQAAIGNFLRDMDAELAALEATLAKTRTLKQAMMQELLTGKTRLFSPEASHA